ncbi:MAG: hypothetical protein ACRBF0_03075 [Calditrichia bacterium]
MKGIFWCVIAVGLLLSGMALAQNSGDNGGELTVPWEEFKRLLNLDENKIVIPVATFHKLLAQSGQQAAPPHAVNDGNVTLTRAEFQKLIDAMKQPTANAQKPPFAYLITKASYSGELKQNNAEFLAEFSIRVLTDEAFHKVPVLPQSLALRNLSVNGKQALVVTENGYHQIVLVGNGDYTVTATFSLKSSLDRGPQKIDLPIQKTPITLFSLQIPRNEIDVEIPQAQNLVISPQKKATRVSAVITPGSAISVRWRKQVEAAEKIPAKLYSDVNHLISIEDDALKTRSEINYTILHSEVDAVRVVVPEGMNVLGVYGEGVGEWQEGTQQNMQVLNIPFTYGKKGNVQITVITETPLSNKATINAFSGIRVLDSVRETGSIGIELNTSAQVTVTENKGLEPVAPQKLPQQLISRSAKPLMMGFKYLKHPFNLLLDIEKHEKVAVPVAAISSANVVTLLTEDGKLVNRIIYQIKNSAKQFLELELPEDADVWSVFVDNKPVESSLNKDRKLLVPLLRSNRENNMLKAFPVEVIYALSETGFSWFGSRSATLPAVDLMTSQILWSVYLPNDYSYTYFNSSLEKEEIIRGVNVFGQSQRRYDSRQMNEALALDDQNAPAAARADKMKKAYAGEVSSSFRNNSVESKELSEQVAAEMEFGGRMEQRGRNVGAQSAGVLPVHLEIPTSGQVYRFARTIINPDDPLTMDVSYVQLWVADALRWAVYALIALLIYLSRNRLRTLLIRVGNYGASVLETYREHLPALRRMAESGMTPFVLLGLVVITWSFSAFLTMLFFFALWVSLVYQVMQMRRRKAGKLDAATGETDIIIE